MITVFSLSVVCFFIFRFLFLDIYPNAQFLSYLRMRKSFYPFRSVLAPIGCTQAKNLVKLSWDHNCYYHDDKSFPKSNILTVMGHMGHTIHHVWAQYSCSKFNFGTYRKLFTISPDLNINIQSCNIWYQQLNKILSQYYTASSGSIQSFNYQT